MSLNVSRDSFDADKRVQKKVFQEGTVVVDSDLNESIDVALDSCRRALSCSTGHVDVRFDDGFSLEGGQASDLTVLVKAGNAAFHLDDSRAVLVRNDTDVSLTGFASWVSGGVERTDIVYIDIIEVEYGPSDDANIVSPSIGVETCRDIRLQWTLAIASDASVMPTPPAGHTYRELARITKDATTTDIIGKQNDITPTLQHFRSTLFSTMEIPIWSVATQNHSGSDAESLSAVPQQYYVQATSTDPEGRNVVKIPYMHDPAHRYLALYCECWVDEGANGRITLNGGAYGGLTSWVYKATPSLQVTYQPVSIPPWTSSELWITIEAWYKPGQSGDKRCWIQKPIIVAGLGTFDNSKSFGVLP